VSRWREAFRGTVRAISQYDVTPLVLIPQPLEYYRNESMLYCRLTSSTNFDNIGWRFDGTASRWEPVGDVAMTFEEEV
jgi:hypothetical protein